MKKIFCIVFLCVLSIAMHAQPLAPSGLIASTVSSSKVIITWTDNAANETGFQVERSLTSGSGYSLITTTAANVVSYADLGLTAGTKYYYRVRAANGSGNSAYTAEVNAQAAQTGFRRFLIDFGDPANQTATTGWNNVTNIVAGTINTLVESTGTSSTLNIETLAEPSNNYGAGADFNSQGYNGTFLDYPASACNDSHYSYMTGGAYRLNGLDNTKVYTIRIFGSRAVTDSDRVGSYTLGGQTKTLNCASNSNQVVLFENVVPSAGTITLNFNVASGSLFGYLNIMDIIENPVPLTAPTTLTATAASSSQINLTWADASSNETGFQIERSLTAGTGFTLITTTAANATTYSNTGLAAGTQYFYRIRATNGASNSAYTAETNATTTSAIVIPTIPTTLAAATASSTQINLTWVDASSNETGFQIERSLTSGTGFTLVTTTAANATSYSNTGLTAGTLYYYRIRATNAGGNSAYTSEVSATTTPTAPVAPTTPAAVAASSTQINLTWVDASSNETGFQIERSLTSGTGFTLVTTTAANATSYSNTGLTAGTLYYYRIRATNAGGNSAYTSEVSATTTPTAPVVPTTPAAVAASSTQINLTWVDASSNETGFQIERSLTSGTGFTLVTTTAANATSYSNTGLTAGTLYYYRIRATNAGGNSAYTSEVSATTTPTAPVAPTTPAAVAASSTQINLTWVDASSNETGFQIERSLTSGTGFTLVTTTAANANSYSNTALTAGTRYYYRIRAINAGGSSAYTSEVNATTPLIAPTLPASVPSSPTSTTLSWTDNSSNETGFQVERSTTSGTGFTLVTTTSANATTFTHTGLVNATKYYYRIRAANAVGYSAYTSEIQVNPAQDLMNLFAFQYKYDSRNRMIAKKVPGADWVYMVYDKRDRLVMTQDGEQRKTNKWSYTKYDVINRPIMTGIYTHSGVLDQAGMTALISTTLFSDTYNGIASTHGYTNTVFPTTNLDVLTVTYYDNYSFKTLINDAQYNYKYDEFTEQYKADAANNSFLNILGQASGTKVKMIGTSTYLWNVNYYDDHYRVVQSISTNVRAGVDRSTMVYDFVGKVLKTKTVHNISSSPKTIARVLTYDHAGRLLKTTHSVNGATPVLLGENKYNELGQVITRRLHSTDNTTFKQNVDYRYNIRGWLNTINDVNTPEASDLFSMNLNYNTPTANGGAAQYNGNISEVLWKGADKKTNSYAYSYDAMNRLTEAKYYNAADPTQNNRFNEKIWDNANNVPGYDLNGNIKFLSRSGKTGVASGITTYGNMDNLIYTYVGNQLLKVADSNVKTEGFVDGANVDNDYTYDANGNMITDKNKSITAVTTANGNSNVTYNYLNLVDKVVKSTGDYVKYTYDATGRKLKQEVYSPTNVLKKKTDYAGEFFYENDTLKFINHEEGRITMTGAQPEYQYNLKDHLGNVRVTFTTKEETETNTATLESANLTAETSKFLRRDRVRIVNNPWFDHTNDATAANGGAIRLNGSVNEKTGLIRSMAVMPGDVINAEVYAKYIDTNPANWTAALNTLLTQIANGTTPAGTVIDGASYPTNSSNPFSLMGMNNTAASTGTGPKAYLNYLVFDKDFNFKTGGYQRLSATPKESGSNVAHEKLSVQVNITEAGYVYIYLSNEEATPVEVYMDDFVVTQVKSPVIASNDYYPFGLTFNSYSRENSVPNKFKFQGQEHIDDLNLGWDSFKWRNHQPDIGRFFNVDPLADKYVYNSPYAFSENHVTSHVELEGLEKVSVHVRHFIPESRAGAGFYRGDNRGFTTSQNVTSRINHSVTIDTQSKGFTSSTTSSPTKLYTAGPLSDKGVERTAAPDGKIVSFSTSGNAINVSTAYSAKDPLATSAAPAIDFQNNITVNPDYANGSVTVSGTTTGDQYPAAESFVSDEAGNSVFIGVAPAQGNITDSYGTGNKTLISNTVKISTDNNGNFKGVYGNDGKVIPLEDHNKNYQSTKPN